MLGLFIETLLRILCFIGGAFLIGCGAAFRAFSVFGGGLEDQRVGYYLILFGTLIAIAAILPWKRIRKKIMKKGFWISLLVILVPTIILTIIYCNYHPGIYSNYHPGISSFEDLVQYSTFMVAVGWGIVSLIATIIFTALGKRMIAVGLLVGLGISIIIFGITEVAFPLGY